MIAGTMFGATSPVSFPHPIIYAEVKLEAGATLALDPAWGERGVYLVAGAGSVDGETLVPGELAVAGEGPAVLMALKPLHAMILGGAAFPEARHIEWNFVSHSLERIERAKADWEAGRFERCRARRSSSRCPKHRRRHR